MIAICSRVPLACRCFSLRSTVSMNSLRRTPSVQNAKTKTRPRFASEFMICMGMWLNQQNCSIHRIKLQFPFNNNGLVRLLRILKRGISYRKLRTNHDYRTTQPILRLLKITNITWYTHQHDSRGGFLNEQN